MSGWNSLIMDAFLILDEILNDNEKAEEGKDVVDLHLNSDGQYEMKENASE